MQIVVRFPRLGSCLGGLPEPFAVLAFPQSGCSKASPGAAFNESTRGGAAEEMSNNPAPLPAPHGLRAAKAESWHPGVSAASVPCSEFESLAGNRAGQRTVGVDDFAIDDGRVDTGTKMRVLER